MVSTRFQGKDQWKSGMDGQALKRRLERIVFIAALVIIPLVVVLGPD